ncbi:hypothetical protein [Mangrovimonas cancribranchiae]|uniref:Uncharacterized protein n=1 Tax=Mangrovimonas cancribranchiae TaxID=3080055 RepID=A0AAU6NWK0_9FLAO
MKDALKILEANQLMRHLILFKLYIESDGAAMKYFYQLEKSIEDLYGDDFSRESFLNNKRYLDVNNGFIDRNATFLTYEGLDYLEKWLKSFGELNNEDKDLLNKKLPKPIFDFFKFSKETTTVLSFVNQVLKLSDRF